jgi:flagellar biogenesis protein FliO
MTATSAAVAKPVDSKPVSSTSTQPIPFRKEGITNTPEVFGLLVTTLLLVAVFAVVAWYARRRGWLDRWVGPKPDLKSNNKKIVVLEARRISQKTTLYWISSGDNEYLLAESSMQIQMLANDVKKEAGND